MNKLIFFLFAGIGMSAMAQTTYVYKYEYSGGRRTVRSLLATQAKSDFETATPELVDSSVQIVVYPNPVQNELHVQCSGIAVNAEQSMQIGIFTSGGTPLHSSASSVASTNLDFSGYASGNYLLQVQVGNQRRLWQIVKP